MRLLLLDIETAPHIAAVWGLWGENIPIDRLMRPGYTLCWSAKWHGEKEIMFESVLTGKARMVKRIHKLMNEADAVCHYNGRKFDVPTLQKEMVLLDLPPPSPSKQVDLYEVAKKKFRFASNKLDFVAQQLGLGSKVKHKGMELWFGCMNNNKKDWHDMEEYNRQDVVLLEKVYDRLLPWIDSHPNQSVMDGHLCCTKCGSTNKQARGFSVSQAGRYPRFQCNDCGSWFRGARRERAPETYREAR